VEEVTIKQVIKALMGNVFMSRGPGKWQRIIINALKQEPAVYLMDLLLDHCRHHKHKQYVALHRAAVTLWKKGRIAMSTYEFGVGSWARVLLHRAGSERPTPRPIPRYWSYVKTVQHDYLCKPRHKLRYYVMPPPNDDLSTDTA
jgi:hypothetical protein